jgi:hypothetical protein
MASSSWLVPFKNFTCTMNGRQIFRRTTANFINIERQAIGGKLPGSIDRPPTPALLKKAGYERLRI